MANANVADSATVDARRLPAGIERGDAAYAFGASRSSRLRILPIGVFGMASRNST